MSFILVMKYKNLKGGGNWARKRGGSARTIFTITMKLYEDSVLGSVISLPFKKIQVHCITSQGAIRTTTTKKTSPFNKSNFNICRIPCKRRQDSTTTNTLQKQRSSLKCALHIMKECYFLLLDLQIRSLNAQNQFLLIFKIT